MNPKKRLGEMLIEAGIIDEAQLRSALGHQRQWGVRLGQALVDLKLASEADIVRALSAKFGFPVAQLGALEPRALEQALRLLPRDFAARNNVFPMAADGASLTIAMSDPTNLAVADEIRFRTGKRVKVCMGGDREVAEAVKRHYPAGEGELESIALDLDVDEGPEAGVDPFGGGSNDAPGAFTGQPRAGAPAPRAAPSAPAHAPVRRAPPPPAAPSRGSPSVPPRASTPARQPAPAPAARPGPARADGSPAVASRSAPAAQAAPAAAAQPAGHGGPPSDAAVAVHPPAAARAAPSAVQRAPAAAVPAKPEPAAAAAKAAAAAPAAARPAGARPPLELELEERAPAGSPSARARPAEPDLALAGLAPFPDGLPAGDPFLASDLAAGEGPGGEGAVPDARALTAEEVAILDSLERLAGGHHAEPDIVKPAQAMAALVRLLLRKRIITEQEFLDEFGKK